MLKIPWIWWYAQWVSIAQFFVLYLYILTSFPLQSWFATWCDIQTLKECCELSCVFFSRQPPARSCNATTRGQAEHCATREKGTFVEKPHEWEVSIFTHGRFGRCRSSRATSRTFWELRLQDWATPHNEITWNYYNKLLNMKLSYEHVWSIYCSTKLCIVMSCEVVSKGSFGRESSPNWHYFRFLRIGEMFQFNIYIYI